ncbi:ABC transporter permease [Streptosporangiaceae bacterium NEAU-GS5]|nr:ABC transporter permease [Streptosporangiaceae bacterium NEAU-GS5]
MTSTRVIRGAIGVAGLLAVAELAGRTGLLDPAVVPLTSTVVSDTVGLAVDSEFLTDVSFTLIVWAVGLGLASLLAVSAGMLLGSLPRAESAVRPVLEFLRPIPSVALIPLVTLVVASDAWMKITVVVYAAMWPVLINTMYGLREVDPLAKETLRSFGFGRLDVLRRVSLPSAAPFVGTGIRLAASVALIVAISAELLSGGAGGIGVYIIKAGSADRVDLMLAAAMWAGVLGLIVNSVLVRGQRRLFRWHEART